MARAVRALSGFEADAAGGVGRASLFWTPVGPVLLWEFSGREVAVREAPLFKPRADGGLACISALALPGLLLTSTDF